MQIGTSYLQKPRHQNQRRRRKPKERRNPQAKLAAQAQATGASAQVVSGMPGSARRPAKGRAAIRFAYRLTIRIFLLGSLLVLAILVLFLWAPRARPGTAKELPLPPNMTAKTAYDLARPAALRWAQDSQLLSLSGTWDSGGNFLAGEGDWSLLFYSPSQAATAHISVTEGSATVVTTHGVLEQPRVQPVELWRLDSPEVVRLLISNGGDEFLRAKPQAGMTLSLNLVGEPAWSARLINQEDRRILEVQMDADGGELIEIRQLG